MAQNKYRGVEEREELQTPQIRFDTRRWTQKVGDFCSQTDGVVAAAFTFPLVALLLVMVPLSGEFMVLLMGTFYLLFVHEPIDKPHFKKTGDRVPKKRFDFPFRVPFFAKLFDGSHSGKQLGGGITYLGKEISTKLEIWTGNSDLRTHMLVLGTTGSGKTEFLLGLVYNALVQNSGFIYTDGKGDVNLYWNVFRLARYLGREDDLVAINFLTSGRDFLDKQVDRTTNTMNPFALGSSGMLIELIISLMDDSGGGGDMWKGRAIAFVSAQTRVLTFLRDRGYLLLDSNTFIQFFELPVVEKMVWDHTITIDGSEIKITDPLFEKVLEPMRAYLLTLPGYKREAKGAQEQKTVEQHGFITMQLTRLFGDMSFTYGYLFQTSLGEVDMYDVVINRRILVVMLPALERAPDSLKMLGKLIVGAIKQMMAGCLGNRLEGLARVIVDARPTNAAVPFYVVLDEYGYYAVLGFAVAPAQARSLGFSITFAAQDFSSLQKASKEEADATWENTNVRVVGRVTSGEESETFRRMKGLAGQALVQQGGGKEFKSGDLSSSYVTVRDTRPERVGRIDFDDFAQQENGEFHFLIGKKASGGRGGVRVIRGRTFYIQVDEKPSFLRLNHFIKVEPPRAGNVDQDLEIIDLLEEAVTGMIKSGELTKLFPNDPYAMAQQKLPVALLSTATYIHEAQARHQLSLPEAVRFALVCAEREVGVQQAQQVAKLKGMEADKQAAAAGTPDAELPLSIGVLQEADVQAAASPPVMPMAPAPAPVAPKAEEEVAAPSVPPSDAVPVAAKPPGSASSYLDDDEEDEGEKGGAAGGTDTAAGNATTDKQDGKQDSKQGAKSGSGGMNSTLDLTPSPKGDASPGEPSLGAALSSYLGEFDFGASFAGSGSQSGSGSGEAASGGASDGVAESESVEPIQISVLTLRPLGENEEPNDISSYLESKIAETDVLIGAKEDALAIKADAEKEVDKIEKATAYAEGTTPEPATLQSFDDLLVGVVNAAERNVLSFD